MKQLFYLFCVTFITACSREPVAPIPVTSAEIRILNGTNFNFTDCAVDPTGKFAGDPAFNYGSLNVAAFSDYHLFYNIYRYSWIRITMNNKSYSLNPIDFVGETPLSGGKYTYKITYLANDDRINLEFIP